MAKPCGECANISDSMNAGELNRAHSRVFDLPDRSSNTWPASLLTCAPNAALGQGYGVTPSSKSRHCWKVW
jgi:hypothetical protein